MISGNYWALWVV